MLVQKLIRAAKSIFPSVFLSLILFILLIPFSSVIADDDADSGGDAGNDFTTALEISPGIYSGALTHSSDLMDYYRISVTKDQLLNVIMTPNISADFDLALYNAPSSFSLKSSSTKNGTGVAEVSSEIVGNTGYWYIKVYIPRLKENSGSYTLQIALNEMIQDDAGTGKDAGNSTATAIIIENGDYNGTLIKGIDEVDFYNISVSSGQLLNITLTPDPNVDIDLWLYNPIGDEIKRTGHFDSYGDIDFISHVVDRTGDWFIKVRYMKGKDLRNYALELILKDIVQDDAGSGGDAGNSTTTSISIGDGVYNGTLVKGIDEVDFYNISVSSGQLLNITLTPDPNVDIDLWLCNPIGDEIKHSQNFDSYGDIDFISHVVDRTGDWFIKVKHMKGESLGHYTLHVVISGDKISSSGTHNIPGFQSISIILSLITLAFFGIFHYRKQPNC